MEEARGGLEPESVKKRCVVQCLSSVKVHVTKYRKTQGKCAGARAEESTYSDRGLTLDRGNPYSRELFGESQLHWRVLLV